MQAHWRSRYLLRYAAAITAVLGAAALRPFADPVFGEGTPYLTLYPVSTVVALLAGLGPAAIATFIGCVVTEYAHAEPMDGLNVTAAVAARVGVVVLSAVLVGYVGRRLRAITARAEAQSARLEVAREESSRGKERLRLAREATGIGTWEHDLITGRLIWDEQYRQVFGLPRDAHPSMNLLAATVHPDDRERVMQIAEGSMLGGTDSFMDYRIVRQDGELRWIHSRGSTQRDANGKPIRVAGIVMDVTAAKLAEQALIEARDELTAEVADLQRLHAMGTRLLPEGDIDALVTEILSAAMELLRATMGSVQLVNVQREVLQMKAAIGFGSDFADVAREIPPGYAACGTAWQRCQRVIVEDVRSDPIFTDDILEIAERSGFRAVCSTPLFSRTGAVLGTLSVNFREPHRPSERELRLLDLYARQAAELIELAGQRSERAQAEHALQQSEFFQRQALESIPGMVFTTKPDGYCDYKSRQWAEFTGVPLEQQLGSGWTLLLHPDDRERAYAAWHSAVQQHADYDLEYRLRRHDGEYRWFKVRGRPIRDAEGQIVRWFGIALDVEDIKRAEEELRRRAEEIERLMEIAPAAIWVAKDPQCLKIIGNSRANEMYEAVGDENVSATTLPHRRRFFQHGQELSPDELPMQLAVSTNREVPLSEIEVLLPSGRQMTMLGGAGPLRDAEGGVRGGVAAFIDISTRKAMEDALRRSEQQLRVAIDAAEMGTWVYDFAECACEFDQRAQQLYGLTSPRLAHDPKAVQEWMHPDDIDGMWRAVEAASDPNGSGHYYAEYRVLLPNGAVRWVNAWGQAEFEGHGAQRRPVRILGASRDVTEPRQAEDALRESEERFRSLADGLPLIVWVHDAQGQLQFVNATYGEFFGITLEQAKGGGWKTLLHPDDADAYAGEFVACVNDHRPFHAETRARRADGQWHWIESWGRPRFSRSGEFMGFIGSSVNTTDRKQAEDALRESEQRLQIALKCGRMGSWDWQVGTDRVEWSEGHYAVLGYGVGEVQPSYSAFRRRVHPEDLERQDREIREAMEQHREYLCEYRVIWPDGTVHWIEARGQYLYEESGKAVRMHGVLVDIDERRRRQDQRLSLLDAERAARMESEQLVRLKDEFLATVSHELRSPLSAIVGWAGLLAKGKAEPARAIEIIGRSASSLTQIVDDLLDTSRIVSGKIRLKCEEVDLLEVVNNVVDGVQLTAEAKSIAVRVSFEPDLSPIQADPNRIQQVIWNLLTNSIKFTPPGGQVDLSVSQLPGSVAISVRDTGKGIAPDFLPHLFERFRQEDGGIARQHGGLGLGLSIVKHLVELHGGTIEAHSPGEDKGATFTVTLPRSNADSASLSFHASYRPPGESRTELDECTLEGMRVISVDDDPFSRELLSRILSDAGAIVRMAESAEEACRLLEEFKPDLLISDVGMPGEDGFGFIQRLRAMKDWRSELPAIAVTALSRPEDHEKAIQCGFDEHVGKPFDPALLCRTALRVVQARVHVDFSNGGAGNGQTRRVDRDGEARLAKVTPEPEQNGHAEHPFEVNHCHILLAEDNMVISEMVKAALEEHGYRVSVAQSVAEGVAIAAQSPIDMLLSDLRLKDGNGWDLLGRLPSNRLIPAIVMSGFDDKTYIERSKEAGFGDYLVKPVDTDDLIRAVDRALRRL